MNPLAQTAGKWYCQQYRLSYNSGMRLVLDTATMVAAIRSDAGASRRLLVGALQRRFVLLVSVPLLVEYEAVMTRDGHLEAAGLSVRDVTDVLDAVAAVAVPVKLNFLWRPLTRDPGDDMVLETAVNGMGHAIATFNVRDFETTARHFGIDVLRPNAAWLRLEAET